MSGLKRSHIGVVLLLAVPLLSSCAQLEKVSGRNDTPSGLFEAPHNPKPAAPKEAEEQPETGPASPFLAGLSSREIERVKAEALRRYGRDWKVIGRRSRYVRAPMLEALAEAGAPSELQIVPVVESGYNPYARSTAGASGLWQLMPQTARELKIRSDRSFDGRRNVYASTKGAARHLMRQYRRLGNWPMAFASYHLGAGGVRRRLIRRPWKPEDGLRKLPLPPITKTYVRHLIGLIALHEEGKLRFPAPYPTRKIKVRTPVDLVDLHRKSGLPKHQIFRFNPGLGLAQYYENRPATLELRISKRRVHAIKEHIPSKPPEFVKIRVGAGETMRHISEKFDTSIGELLRANPDLPPVRLTRGQILRIPARLLNNAHAEPNPLSAAASGLLAAN